MNNYNQCLSCVDGEDLPPGAKCSVCGRHKVITGYRKCEYPMTKDDEDRGIPVTEVQGE